jgi:hypothetical protein
VRRDRFGTYRWIPLWHWEVRWRHWGLEIGVSMGSWIPAEYSLHFGLGPIGGCVGIEKEYDR